MLKRSLLIAEGIVHDLALGYEHRFTEDGGELTVYAEHGNEEDSQNAIVDYGHPLIIPMGTHVVTQLVNRIEPLGRFAGPDDATTLSDIDNIYPLEMVPWWLFSNYFYRQARRFMRYVLLPAIVILFALRYLNHIILRLSQGRLPEFSAGRMTYTQDSSPSPVVIVVLSSMIDQSRRPADGRRPSSATPATRHGYRAK